MKDPSETGRGKAGQWRVFRCEGEDGDEKECKGDNPLHKEGVYLFRSVAGDKHLRVGEDGSVDADGGKGKWARFVVDIKSMGSGSGGGSASRKVRLQSIVCDKYLRIKEDGSVDGDGGAGKWTLFKVHNHGDGIVSLQSNELSAKNSERYHIGGTSSKALKDPIETGRGDAGKWHVYRCDGETGDEKECKGGDPLHKEGIYLFKSKAGGKHLRIQEDKTVDVDGGKGKYARFRVHHG